MRMAPKGTTQCLLHRAVYSNMSTHPGLSLSADTTKLATISLSKSWGLAMLVAPAHMLGSVGALAHFIAMKKKKMLLFLEDLHKMQFPSHFAVSLPPYQWVWTATLQPNTASFREAHLQLV